MYRELGPGRVFFNFINFCQYRNDENNEQDGAACEVPALVLYDGACPLCRAEMQRLQERDRGGRLLFVDFSAPEFDEQHWGRSRAVLATALHVLTGQGVWLIGMPAIRHVYQQVGLGWLVAPTAWPGFAGLADLAYRYIAPNRLLLSRWLGLAPALCSDTHCPPPQGGQPS